MPKDLKLNIRIDEDKDTLLRSLGGHTKGFETIADFYLENYKGSEAEKREKKKKQNLEKITGRKK